MKHERKQGKTTLVSASQHRVLKSGAVLEIGSLVAGETSFMLITHLLKIAIMLYKVTLVVLFCCEKTNLLNIAFMLFSNTRTSEVLITCIKTKMCNHMCCSIHYSCLFAFYRINLDSRPILKYHFVSST